MCEDPNRDQSYKERLAEQKRKRAAKLAREAAQAEDREEITAMEYLRRQPDPNIHPSYDFINPIIENQHCSCENPERGKRWSPTPRNGDGDFKCMDCHRILTPAQSNAMRTLYRYPLLEDWQVLPARTPSVVFEQRLEGTGNFYRGESPSHQSSRDIQRGYAEAQRIKEEQSTPAPPMDQNITAEATATYGLGTATARTACCH